MNKNLFIFGLIFLVLIIIAVVLFGSFQAATSGKTANIHEHIVQLEIADNQQTWQKGLSNRNSLPENKGMVFLFPSKSTFQFWMKNMQFPIDIIFLSDDKVVTIYSNVQPKITLNSTQVPNLTLYSSTKPANKVLELNASQANKFGLKGGDQIKFNL